jgi:hypothetical protein
MNLFVFSGTGVPFQALHRLHGHAQHDRRQDVEGAPADVLAALRDGRPLPDAKLQALAVFSTIISHRSRRGVPGLRLAAAGLMRARRRRWRCGQPSQLALRPIDADSRGALARVCSTTQ